MLVDLFKWLSSHKKDKAGSGKSDPDVAWGWVCIVCIGLMLLAERLVS